MPSNPDDPRDDTATLADAPRARETPRPKVADGPRTAVLDESRYVAGEQIGRGGMGEVLAAHDTVIGRDVAIKRMLDPSPATAEIARFMREAKIQGTLDHPAIPPVYELARDERGRPCFVMKRLHGTTLAVILRGISRADFEVIRHYPRERLLRAFAEVCLAVEYAHVRGVVHRDLKPSNIMLGEFGEVFVLDWGVAKIINSTNPELAVLRTNPQPENDTTQVGTTVGTPAYMAPEQRAGSDHLDGRADVYALGCVLLEILRGRPAHQAKAALGDLDLPPELEELSTAAVAEDVSARLRSARELGDGVVRYLDGDRDLALRRRLAQDHLDHAEAALLGDVEARRMAIREAGRALALDPTLPRAAELITRLMLEPPSTTPPEVDELIAEDHRRSAIQHARFGVIAYGAYLAFIPFLVWLGGTSRVHLAMLAILTFGLMLAALHATRKPSSTSARFVVGMILGNAALIALCARMFSPFIIAPGAAVLMVAVLFGSPAYRQGRNIILMLTAMCIAIIGPWVAEVAGGADRTIRYLPLTSLPGVPRSNPVATAIGIAAFVIVLVVLSGLLIVRRARAEDAARREVHMHTWQISQLVPDRSPAHDRSQ